MSEDSKAQSGIASMGENRKAQSGMFDPIIAAATGVHAGSENFAIKLVEHAIAERVQHIEQVQKNGASERSSEARAEEKRVAGMIESAEEARLDAIAQNNVLSRNYSAAGAETAAQPISKASERQYTTAPCVNRSRISEIRGIESAWGQAKTPDQAREIMNGQSRKQNGQTQ